MIDILPIGNAVDVFVKGFRASANDIPITDAVLTFTIYDPSGTPLAEATGISMPHLGDGHYRGTASDLALTLDEWYRVVVNGFNYRVQWEKSFRARPRPLSKE